MIARSFDPLALCAAAAAVAVAAFVVSHLIRARRARTEPAPVSARPRERTALHHAAGALKDVMRFEEWRRRRLPWHRRERALDAALIRSLAKSDPGSVLARDPEGLLPLHYACDRREEPEAAVLALLAPTREAVNSADDSGRTPLHYAALNRRTQTARFLLSRGADATLRDKKGATALSCALYWEDECEWDDELGPIVFPPADETLVRLLVDAFPDAVLMPAEHDSIGGRLEDYDAALKGDIISGKFPLFDCCAHGSSLEAVRMVMPPEGSPHADYVVNSDDFNGMTALHHAARTGRRDVCELLLLRGAHVDGRGKAGRTRHAVPPLGLCRDAECAALLLRSGADATSLIYELGGSSNLRLPREMYALAFAHLLRSARSARSGAAPEAPAGGSTGDLALDSEHLSALAAKYEADFDAKANAPPHAHPLARVLGWNKGCDCCNALGPEYVMTCSHCSYDECEACFEKRREQDAAGPSGARA
jgi:Ankyrin repeats (3 copies)